MTVYVQLFLEFFKTGLFAVGGGLATLPFLYELADKYGWYTAQELTDMIAVSESTPGAIGINMSTYAGYNAAGILGGIVATLSLALPSIVIILIVAQVLEKFSENRYVKSVFSVLRPLVVGLIAAAGYQLIKIAVLNTDAYAETGQLSSMFDLKAGILFLVLLVLVLKWKKHPIVFIGIGAAAGIVLQM